MITLNVSSFITHKKAESPDVCQDAIKANEKHSRYAIADGATRSFFPKQWAELLVEHFCEEPDLFLNEENWKEWLVPIQETWYKQVEERVKAKGQFYLTNSLNAREPAVSTFVGLEFNKGKRQWQAIVVGDSCLFHKSNTGFRSFLIQRSENFTSRPEAFASFAEWNQYDPEFISGEMQSGDMFILATDALAKWILEHDESGNLDKILDQFHKIEGTEQFDLFVEHARDNEDIPLVNDDVALMLISVEEPEVSGIGGGEQKSISEAQTSEDIESRINILEVILWVLFAGFVGFWTARWIYRFFRDLIRTLVQ